MTEPAEPMSITWSIITVTYNSAETLLMHWSKTTVPSDTEWIVVDNDSSDNSAEVARSLGARVIQPGANLGFSAANNLAYRSSRGKYVAFVNPDVVVDWESLIILRHEIARSNAIVAPQLTNPDGSLQPNGRGVPSLPYKIQNRLRLDKEHSSYRYYAADGERRYVCWAIGAAIASSRSQFDRLEGPWDDRYFLYYEDADICLRAWQRNIAVMVTGEVRWRHTWARETIGLSWLPWKREFASMAKFYGRFPKFLVFARAPRYLRACQARWGEVVPW